MTAVPSVDADLRAAYARDGVVVVDQVLDPDLLEEVRANIDRYCRFIVPRLPEEVRAKTVRFEPDGTSIRSIYYMDQVDEYFNALGNREDFKALVRGITGWEPELYVVETFNKYARVGTDAVAHQDVAYFRLEPKDMAHLWIAIDPATLHNGAIRYWLGSHKDGLLPHYKEPRFGYLQVRDEYADESAEDIFTAELSAGHAVVHSGLVVHDSPHNYSGVPRLGLLCGYRGAHTEFLGLGQPDEETDG